LRVSAISGIFKGEKVSFKDKELMVHLNVGKMIGVGLFLSLQIENDFSL
jgi:hypothetical protein